MPNQWNEWFNFLYISFEFFFSVSPFSYEISITCTQNNRYHHLIPGSCKNYQTTKYMYIVKIIASAKSSCCSITYNWRYNHNYTLQKFTTEISEKTGSNIAKKQIISVEFSLMQVFWMLIVFQCHFAYNNYTHFPITFKILIMFILFSFLQFQ